MPQASDDPDYFARRAAEVTSSREYEEGLKREQEELERQRIRARDAHLRELAAVAIQALNGKHGEQHQAFARDVLTKHGDVRAEVAALARWDVTHRAAEPSLPLDRPILKTAVESWAVEHSLRAFEALHRQVEHEKRKARKEVKRG